MFSGVFTALVTPFREDGAVDYDGLRRLIEAQIAAGVDGLVPCGTTGESPTLTYEEHHRVVEVTVEVAAGRVKVIAGTGSNSTHEALELTQHALGAGADATLQVTPYYNKPSQEGLYRHFAAIADVGLPVMLYNIPGRTGREIELDTLARLAAHPRIVAVKEAGGSAERVSAILARCSIDVLSGDDVLTLSMMVLGAKGVVSVASNVAPGPMRAMAHAALAGRWAEAAEIHRRLYPVFRDLFIDTNPIPVKAAMAMLGTCEEVYRLPLCETTAAKKAQLRCALVEAGLLHA